MFMVAGRHKEIHLSRMELIAFGLHLLIRQSTFSTRSAGHTHCYRWEKPCMCVQRGWGGG